MNGKRDPYIQAIRGLAIASVVLIHCLPLSTASVVFRPFLNSAVAAFVFLSGYLTTPEKAADASAFLRRRVGKVAAPYFVWTAAYLMAKRIVVPSAVLTALAVGGASPQLYYLVVYLQLVLLTPLLFRLLEKPGPRAALYVVTPLTLCVRYMLSIAGISLPIQAFCGSWLVYYLLGFEWRNRIDPLLQKRGVGFRHCLALLAVGLLLQGVEGFAWLSVGDYDLATTQLKLTSMLSSVCACGLIPQCPRAVRQRLASCVQLVRLGDLSFGIYLVHMAVLVVIRRLFLPLSISGFPPSVVLWLITLVASATFILLCRRIIPRRTLGYLGFAQ